ncbi:MAG: hypothetical protein P1V13_22255 [Rhizobiaceae bacterium]|nr:hypothetical protein [Rhizobiaceae bacterium]
MIGIGTIIAATAAKVGAGMVRSIIENRLGGSLGQGAGQIAGDLTTTVINTVARKAGVEPIDLPNMAEESPLAFEKAVLATEAEMPEMIALWSKGLDSQFALLQAEQKEGGLQSFWRYGWMYLLAAFWIWRIIVMPIVNSRLAVPVDLVDFGTLMTLTSWFMALYMGGHTVKDLGKSALQAMKDKGQ